jgi:hypothetical protein
LVVLVQVVLVQVGLVQVGLVQVVEVALWVLGCRSLVDD